MPAPANADELLDLVQRSGVIDETRLRDYVKKLGESSGIPGDPQKFAGVMVRDGILTYFQAEQLLQGKYKRFSIGKYKVLEKLGAGGMAQVFLCEHKLMRRRVAIKVLPTAKADDPSSLSRFYREARAVAAVDHPNIVRAYDIDQDEHLHFLVMEYVDGTNLQDLVKRFGPLDITRACHYIYGAAVGLQHAHEMGLVHRDIKPGNILLDRTGVVKILDMGLARFFHDEDDALTRKYDENILGTADYLAPEQAEDSHTVDIRADIYSLGATFYYLLTGSAPFPEGSVAQKLIRHQKYSPRPIQSLRPEVPEQLVAVIDRMMMKKPEERFQTPADVMAQLAPWVATPIAPPSDKEMPQISAAAAGTRGPSSMTTQVGSGRPGSGAPPTMVAPTQPTVSESRSGQPLLPTSPPATTPAPANPTVWESLDDDTETQTVARGDTDRTADTERPRQRPTYRPSGGPNKLLLALVALVLLGGAAAGVYFGFIKDSSPDPEQTQDSTDEPPRIVVSSAGGEDTVPTLVAALRKAEPGAVIVINDAKIVLPSLVLAGSSLTDVTIEGADPNAPTVIEAKAETERMVGISRVAGIRLRNLVFDGVRKAELGIDITGTCPGLQLENVVVRNTKRAGIRFGNASGADSRSIVLERVRVQVNGDTQSGVLMESQNADNRYVAIRNCRFEGNNRNGTGTRITGATLNVEVSGNRFFNLGAAVALAEVPINETISCQITGNTVVQANSGVLIDAKLPGKFSLNVSQNYFRDTSAIGQVTGKRAKIIGPKIEGNQQANSSPGNAGWKFSDSTHAPLPTDPNDDATFLRFPDGKIGAQ